ncbi:hypothetical protein RQ831_20570 [Roseomonas gilardii]|uniref:Uncharacterized protein n=1 Tax=Roseomonas gilardii TaxID=257708 RepID=A0ABU3ML56_9PROT|nr:hypothetical protein [Roseomonas gilardii]MDT8333450.1 hypothetical protein [Roseomonas gilardii]
MALTEAQQVAVREHEQCTIRARVLADEIVKKRRALDALPLDDTKRRGKLRHEIRELDGEREDYAREAERLAPIAAEARASADFDRRQERHREMEARLAGLGGRAARLDQIIKTLLAEVADYQRDVDALLIAARAPIPQHFAGAIGGILIGKLITSRLAPDLEWPALYSMTMHPGQAAARATVMEYIQGPARHALAAARPIPSQPEMPTGLPGGDPSLLPKPNRAGASSIEAQPG